MLNKKEIKTVTGEKADELYHSLVFCVYCNEPFKECDTIIPGKGIVHGETDVVEYRKHFWHSGCVLDYEKDRRRVKWPEPFF